ncbi:hypothetical protein ACP70R_032956 [Stipagrostis hirtigluma subsp. patula]
MERMRLSRRARVEGRRRAETWVLRPQWRGRLAISCRRFILQGLRCNVRCCCLVPAEVQHEYTV